MNDLSAVDAPFEPTAPPRRRRLLRWLGAGLLLLAAWALGLWGYFRYTTDRDLREAIAEADASDPDWTMDRLLAARKAVREEDNAALHVLAARQKLPVPWPIANPAAGNDEDKQPDPLAQPLRWEEKLADLPPAVQLDAALRRDLRANLDAAAPALAEARKVIGMAEGRFPLDWQGDVLGLKLPSIDGRPVAQLLQLEAVWQAQQGDADAALASVRGGLAVARAVGDEPTTISLLVHVSFQALALNALERVLAQGQPSAAELEQVQRLLEKEAAEPLLLYAARGERAGLHQLIEDMKRGRVTLTQFNGSSGTGFADALANTAAPTLARRSHARVLRMLNRYVEAARLPPEQQAAPIKAIERETRQAKVEYDIVTALVMPAILKAAEASRRGQGNLRCAIVAVALERYRRDHGGWPDGLASLVPEYLGAVPTDPGDGRPLRYKRLADGVLVYWVGLDGEDNGGALDRKNPIAKGTDLGFRLWDPAHRRQPPAEVLPPPTEGPP
jgi:hypothetical protein